MLADIFCVSLAYVPLGSTIEKYKRSLTLIEDGANSVGEVGGHLLKSVTNTKTREDTLVVKKRCKKCYGSVL